MFKYINTEKAPAAVGPYSQAVRAGNMLYASGQIPLVPETGSIQAEDIAGQTEQVCDNVGRVLEAGGMTFDRYAFLDKNTPPERVNIEDRKSVV